MSSKRMPKQTRWGPSQREVLALLFIALSVITLLGLLSVTSGILSDIWVLLLRQIFGLGTYLVVLALLIVGLLLLVRDFNWFNDWIDIIGFEIFFLASLGLLHLGVPGEDPMTLAQTGSGGGYVGWAVSGLLAEVLGYEITAIVLTGFMLWGLILMSPITVRQVWLWSKHTASRAAVYLRGRFSWLAMHWRKQDPKQKSFATAPIKTQFSEKSSKSDKRKPVAIPINLSLPIKKPVPADGEPRLKEPKIGDLPSLDLLDKTSPRTWEESEIRRNAKIIEETLASFGLPVKVVEINHGPAVTQYGVEPGLIERRDRRGELTFSRVRVSKISALVKDLALALAADPLRIEAPVPGRSMLGIEVPNREIAIVSLRSVMESEVFSKMKRRLKIALGQDITGTPLVADLAAMPHLLIAGATGSGKSVCINAIICSLLFNNTPEQLRLLLIDPKMVELTGYNGVPHLLSPVVTDLEHVVGALTWVTRLMEERYRQFSKHRVRNIQEFNRKIARKDGIEELPYLVVVVDELADLMMSAPTEVEWAICRIAQMARATGIHLIIATQRPSVDVVTGLIKANFPARISFAVSSQVDSRVIIDSAGAETLLGRGDMLFIAPDSPRAVRVQGCYVSDNEISKLVQFWLSTSDAVDVRYEGDVPWGDLMRDEDHDDLFDEAVELVRKNGRASASFLQRRLRIGYPRAARLMDQLENEGIIEETDDGGRYRQVTEFTEENWSADMSEELNPGAEG